MSGLRPPVVAGVGGGVGTTTLAAALRGHDGGRQRVGAADILVCRGTLDSLCRAAAVLEHAGPEPRPVLAVTLDGVRARGAVRGRLQLLGSGTGAVVLLPHVGRWRTIPDPVPEATNLLVEPLDRLPRPLRAYAAALRELAGAVAASGRLHPPAGHVGAPPTGPRTPVGAGHGVPRVAARPPSHGHGPAPHDPVPTRQRGVRIVLPVERAEQVG